MLVKILCYILILFCAPVILAQEINRAESNKDSSDRKSAYTKGQVRIARTGRKDTVGTKKLNNNYDKPELKTINTSLSRYEKTTANKQNPKDVEKKYENMVKEYNALSNLVKTDKKPLVKIPIKADDSGKKYEYKTVSTIKSELLPNDTITNKKNKNYDSVSVGTALAGLPIGDSVEIEKKRIRDSTYAAYLIQDSISREYAAAAIGFGYGYGTFGESFSMTIRIYFISISVLFTDLQPGKESITPLDIDPPHNDYTLVNTRTARYGVTAEYYIPISKHFSVFPTLGASAVGYKKIPKSNLTGIYYKPQSQEEVTSVCAGIGLEYRVRLGKYTVGRLQCAYRNTFGAVFTLLLGK